MGKSIMFQGTASNVGKSLLTAGFCRIFKQDGLRVSPFKSQNMALNSFITEEGLEMGRAQVFQAEAAGIKPSAKMNPILLKPTSDQGSQVIVNGKVYGNMTVREYQELIPQLAEMIKAHYETLSSEYEVVVIEGAGSPAEINLRDKGIVNMGMAEIADSPVILIGDIDKGGVFASILGTLMLLREEERARVKGVIINKFRGDYSILEPGIKMLEDLIKIPVLGVVPYTHLKVEDEDSLTSRFYQTVGKNNAIDIAIIHLPHISNFTDFNMLEIQEDVQLRYIRRGEKIGTPDLVILPGSKNTLADLTYLKESGLDIELHKLHIQGTLIMGICGGYQMLGEKIADPYGVEGDMKEAFGLGLLPIDTILEDEKVTAQVEGTICKDLPGLLGAVASTKVKGYEIHMGVTKMAKKTKALMTLTKQLGETINEIEGTCNEVGSVFGTYLHGIFDEMDFTRKLLNAIRVKKGLETVENSIISFEVFKQGEYDKLAQILREHVDIAAIYEILGVKKK